jgi:hypothetical protein
MIPGTISTRATGSAALAEKVKIQELQRLLNSGGGILGSTGSGGGGSAGSLPTGALPAPGTGGAGGGGYDQLQSQLLGQMEGLGDSRREQINTSFANSLDDSLSRLSDRGFGNSSGLASITAGNERDKQSALTGLEDSLLGQRVGVQSQIGLAGLQSQDYMNRLKYSNQLQNQNSLFSGFLGGLF